MRKLLATVLVAPAACFGLLACGDDDDGGQSALERYCELSAKLDEVEQPDDVETADQLASAMTKFFDDNSDLIEDLKDAAPDEISSDLDAAFQAFQKVAEGNLEAIQDLDTDKLDKFNEDNCEEE